ncbi:hypothetical protein HBA54_07855 [Pelagibius litoralis]|uniref:Phosphoribosyl-AMP cyclohydrolase n=1 Tax=Pelagibius litoralis TaxID=374515 RepID=A0A967C4X6_9PROT|nr:hypothetical protein [Pelagibius litoralis]NIA68505.1 hypothetical protein [Pelagibius litoralis]
MKKTIIAALVTGMTVSVAQAATITEDEVLAVQQTWADGIVGIGQAYLDEGDYKAAASQHIRDLYAYEQGGVLFKPTLASEDQFRETFDQALSYFVGGDIAEDGGFAIKPWRQVRFGERQIVLNGETAFAMGNYYFTPADSDEETKVEYTFGYIKDDDGKLRINVHHSSLPFQQ